MAQENKVSKWEATVTKELKNISAEQLWPLFEDMASFQKWVPEIFDVEKCRLEGNNGEPGFVKYCQFTKQAASMFSDKDEPVWCNMKLLSTDPIARTMSYEVTENNLGFKSYFGNVKLVYIDGGCKIQWSFISDPMEAMGLEDLKGFIETILKKVVKEMGTYLSPKVYRETKDAKWEYKSAADMKGIKAEKIWPLLEDFCSYHKWIPGLDSEKCCQVEGTYGKPGLVRYSVFTEQSSALAHEKDKVVIKWCNEKLLSMDPVKRTLSYEVTENNLGFKSYVVNVKVVETDEGSKMEWSFVSDPLEGMRLEDFSGFMELNMMTVAEGIKRELVKHVN